MASGIGEVRLYHNTANTIPVGVYDDITSQFTVGATSDTGSLVKGGLGPGTKYWFWVEVIDVAGNESAILPLGSITTTGDVPLPVPALTADVDQGNETYRRGGVGMEADTSSRGKRVIESVHDE
eukprot:jgi/Tetstr1/426935/TSEL_017148.t1